MDTVTMKRIQESPAQSTFRLSAEARSRGDTLAGRRLGEQALRMDPSIGGAWFNLGNDYAAAGDPASAVACFRRSIELLGNEPHALANLGWSLYVQGDVEGGIEWTERSLAVTRNLAGPINNLCHMRLGLGDLEAGLDLANQAIALDPNNATYRISRSFALLYAGRLAEGLREYESRFRFKLREFEGYPMPLWRGEKVEHLFIVGEQGIGDTIQFGRFVGAAINRASRVTIAVHPAVYKLFCEKFAGDAVTVLKVPTGMPVADAYCPMMSIPVAMDMNGDQIVNDFNAIWLPTDTPASFRVPGRRLHVGIAWAGSPDMENNANRSTTPESFLPLYQTPGVQLYGLQVGPEALPNKYPQLGNLIVDLSGEIRDVTDTLNVVANLDAVVSVCTSAVHIAGAVGTPFAVIPPARAPHWVWGFDGKSPWYPETGHVMRQSRSGDWRAPMDAAAKWLAEMIEMAA